MTHKILFFDIDGTMTSFTDGTIAPSTKLAIHTLIQNGYHVVAATGRPLSMCDDIKTLGIETIISANGALATHQDEIIFQSALSPTIIDQITDLAKRMKHTLLFYSNTLHINEIQNPKALQALTETLFLKEYPPVKPSNTLHETYLLSIFANDEELKMYQEAFPTLSYLRWHPYIANVLERPVSKSVAIEQVLQFFHLTPKDAVAFGDGSNDVDMLEYVDFGIAMGNANDEVKAVAKFVTKDSNHDGIAWALKELAYI